ncbi:MAG: flagellar hook-basal body complex protein FliE [bacterium]
MTDPSVSSLTLPAFPSAPREVPLPDSGTPGSSFGDTLTQFLQDVNELQKRADEKTLGFATGQIRDIHEVMGAVEEAGIAMQLLLEIRNKVVDAYHELMRTQV